ncbi:hypothetical protein [Caproiciproducens galactitolivorans]|uniref:hypothetical protein n=1 Tax=Caproiciproducens galactitolivorans TaxID=642589 RepID=UPI0014382E21|nr:hypothetical protein [Caproiciproducens galactitolivorans]
MDPGKVWKKKDEAIANAAIEAEKLQAGPLFKEVAGVYKEKVMEMKIGTYEP